MTRNAKVAVVIGAGGTLGPAIAAALAMDGVTGLALGDLDGDIAAGIAQALPCSAFGRAVDVRGQKSVTDLVQEAAQRFGRVDVLINNAGIVSQNARIHNLSDTDWRTAFDINLLGTVHGIVAAVETMRESGGSIINTASVAGMTAWTHAAPYGVTKAAIIQLTKVAAVEYARERIRVNCVCPGVFPSGMHDGLAPSVMQSLASRHPLGLGTPDDLVGAYLYLASDAARWTTGTSLVVDGGYAAP